MNKALIGILASKKIYKDTRIQDKATGRVGKIKNIDEDLTVGIQWLSADTGHVWSRIKAEDVLNGNYQIGVIC